jgi:ABC-2 type transport system ATP-binding protein
MVSGFRPPTAVPSVDRVIELRELTKRYGDRVAVDGLTVQIQSGVVTGFLGPNGSGKSTTMRMILGLDAPDHGEALIGGVRYPDLNWPLKTVGALLDAGGFHPGRSARAHLAALAASNDIPGSRVERVLRIVGLSDAATRRAGTYSLGMRQRLGVAVALLGDPGVLLLDEPVNGLDPEGIPLDPGPAAWTRGRRPDGVCVQPPDRRDGADRGPAGGHRPRPAAGRDDRG